MSIKEEIIIALENLDEAELQQVAEYIAFLKFRAKTTKKNRQLIEAAGNYRQPPKGVIKDLIRFFGGYDR
jgi:hypothetical protein